MCGITGFIALRQGLRLQHRGPDGSGVFGGALPWAHVGLEMARLAIVDRTEIPVPFDFTRSCGVVLAYNGEVYNWRELRAELSDGTPWETECDAEVVARGWRRWGSDVLRRLNGMWGFALVDLRAGEIFLARDRAGEKPLYYSYRGSVLHFASEVKALLAVPTMAPCRELEVLEFDCLADTPFQGVKRLGPGQYLHLRSVEDLTRLQPVSWWTLPTVPEPGMTWEQAVEETKALLVDAIRIRVASEVPVAVLLSGGLDSAIVQAVARCDRLYTVSFPGTGLDTWAEAEAVRTATAPQAAHVRVTFDRADLERVLPKVAYHLDTPATWTAVCQWFLASRMHDDGIRVVLSGEGADELFAGYSRYRLLWHLDRALADPVLAEYGPLAARTLGGAEQILARMLDRSAGNRFQDALAIVGEFDLSDRTLVERMAHIDFYTTMQVLLRMADCMVAAFGMENRSPFFDHRLMEFAGRCPVQWKMGEGGTKAVLREVARRLGVPEAIVRETHKRGLAVPWAQWAKDPSPQWDRREFTGLMRRAWEKAFFA